MKRFLASAVILIFASSSLAAISNSDKQGVSFPLISNAGFENNKAGWTASNNTFSIDTTNFFSDGGKASGLMTMSSQTGTLTNTVTPTGQTSGTDMEASCKVKTSLTTIQVCAMANSSEVLCRDVPAVDSWVPVTANFIGPTNGQSVGVRIKSTASATGTVNVDDCYIGKARNIGSVSQAQFIGSLKYAGVSNCIWFGTTSSSFTNSSADTDCNAPSVTGSASAPGTKIPAIVFSTLAPGTYQFVVHGRTGTASANSTFCGFQLNDGTNSFGYSSIGTAGTSDIAGPLSVIGMVSYTTPQTNLTIQLQAARIFGSNGSCQISNAISNDSFTIDVYRFPTASETAYRPDLYNWRVDANISGANPDLGASDQSSYTGIENGSLTLTNNSGNGVITAQIPCSSTNAPSGTTCSAGSESVGVSFNLPAAGDVRACVSFQHDMQVSGSNALINTAFQIVETPNNAQTISQEGKDRQNSGLFQPAAAASLITIMPHKVCGTFSFGSAGQKTLRLFYEQDITATVSENLVLADASSSVGQRDIHWEVYPINQRVPAVILASSQVSFAATTSTTAATTSAPFIFTVKDHDTNTAYSTSTGQFVVPANQGGQYFFNWSVYTAGTFLARLYVNGSFTKNAIQGTSNTPSQGSHIITLVPGDTVEIRPDGNATASGGSTNQTFSGFKLH